MKEIRLLALLLLLPIQSWAQDYRQEMREFVIEISDYSREVHPGFIIIPQNGQELVTLDGTIQSSTHEDYLDAIDGIGREDLFYGFDRNNRATSEEDRQPILDICTLLTGYGKTVMVTDYCHSDNKMDDSYRQNEEKGFISFAADRRELNRIPLYPEQPYQSNQRDITTLEEASNFLYLINSEKFREKQDFIDAIDATNYDILLIDMFHNEEPFTAGEIEDLQTKPNGSRRLLIAYMSIGEAEDYRYYWQENWDDDHPSWVDRENPNWRGNFKVRYWDPLWKKIIFGSPQSYLNLILNAGFDGVYLDIIDAFEYFEDTPEVEVSEMDRQRPSTGISSDPPEETTGATP